MTAQKLAQGLRAAAPYVPVVVSVFCELYTTFKGQSSSAAGSDTKTMRHGRSGGKIGVDHLHRMVKNTWKAPARKH